MMNIRGLQIPHIIFLCFSFCVLFVTFIFISEIPACPLVYKYARCCCWMTGRCPFCCRHTTVSYKLFLSGVNSKPRSLSLWLENLNGFANGLPSSSHLHHIKDERARLSELIARRRR